MATRHDLTLFLGFRFRDDGRHTLHALEALLEEVSALESSIRIPLHWNTPLYPLFSGSSRALNDLATEIKTRASTRADVIVPVGFRGALHPLLDDHELARELSWCRRNPWVPGFRELLGQDPQVIIPVAPDLSREAARGVYSGAGFPVVGIPFGGTASAGRQRDHHRPGQAGSPRLGRLHLYRDPERAAVVAAWVLGLEELAEGSGLAAGLGAVGPGHLLLLLDLRDRGGEEGSAFPAAGDRPVGRLLDALSHRHSVVPASLSEQAVAEAERLRSRHPARTRAGAAEPPLAALLHASEACGRLEAETGLFAGRRQKQAQPFRRQGRRRNLDVRSALDLLAGDREAEGRAGGAASRPSAETGRTGHILFAEMGGVVSLPGPRFVAHFADGRLRGLSRGDEQILSGSPAESWFDFGGRRCFLQTVSAASFEREEDHGLATAFACSLGPAGAEVRLRAEAYFRAELPELRLDLAVTFPPGTPPLQAAAPYEVPLFRLAGQPRAKLETELQSGEWLAQWIPLQEGYLLACGRRVRVSAGGTAVVLAEADGEAHPDLVSVLPLRVRRESGSWVVRACLGGRTCPAAPLPVEGSRTAVSFRIAVGEG
jgi:hypothetical protein